MSRKRTKAEKHQADVRRWRLRAWRSRAPWARGSLPGSPPFSGEQKPTLFFSWVVLHVGRVYFQQILFEVVTRFYAGARRKMNPRGRPGLREPGTLSSTGSPAGQRSAGSTSRRTRPGSGEGPRGTQRPGAVAFGAAAWVLVLSGRG